MSQDISSFRKPLVVTPIDDRNWRLVKPFTYHVGSRNSKFVIKVPKGFETDFASTRLIQWVGTAALALYVLLGDVMPWWASWLVLVLNALAAAMPAWGKHGKPAIIHDWLYRAKIVSRRMADLIFLEAMGAKENPTPKWKARLMYWGVRAFGGFFWKKKERNNARQNR